MQAIFTLGQVYKRSKIHDQYGGNRQGGIAVTANFPYIFIFSNVSGQQHGYSDRWENSNVFSYTGEGQIGDMRFIKGNLALRDHLKSGKRIFLFLGAERSFVRFEAELELIDVDYFVGSDKEGNERTAIRFFFKRKGKQLNYEPLQIPPSSFQEPSDSKQSDIPNKTERKGLVTSRVGQGAYRKSILHRWSFRCAVTNYSKIEILIASHIVAWKHATDEERLDVDNGILLSPTYDALFDQHLISFENNGRIIISNILTKSNYLSLGVNGKEHIKNIAKENCNYLERHRMLLK